MLTRALLILVALLLVVGGIVVGQGLSGTPAEGHAGHPQKKLYTSRWYQQPNGNYAQWMTLTTSQIWFACGTSVLDCQSRWSSPGQQAIADWNAQNTTVDFSMQVGQSILNDVNVFVNPLIDGDPALLGLALFYDSSAAKCFGDACSSVRWAEAYLADEGHTGSFATNNVRRSTVAHELGHVLSLKHESVTYECAQDETGTIPVSIMSYDCINPFAVGGSGYYQVQPWDACGVNHAYLDPTIGFAGCGIATVADFHWYLPSAVQGVILRSRCLPMLPMTLVCARLSRWT